LIWIGRAAASEVSMKRHHFRPAEMPLHRWAKLD